MVGGIAKSYKLPIDYVLYEMSYANVLLYGAVLPSYGDEKDEEELKMDGKMTPQLRDYLTRKGVKL